jgi:uncharacterized iron-regulated membrane protein
MQIRKIFFWLHLAAGCVAGAIVLLMSFTGVLLTYEKQVVAKSERGPLRSDPPVGVQRLQVSDLLAAVGRQREVAGNATLTLRSDPREPAEIRAGRGGAVYVNAYTGAVLTGGATTARTTFQKITAWHRWLGVEGEGRATARAITGACNLAFLFMVVSGAYLWLPRKWSWSTVRSIALFRWNPGGKARDFNWHNVFGIWALVPLFFVVLTALPMSYRWANDLVYRMTGSEAPAAPGKGGDTKDGRATRREAGSREAEAGVGLDKLWERAFRQVPGWKSITARAALSGREPASFAIDTGDGGQPQKRSTLLLNPATGAVVRWETFGDGSAGRRLRSWTRFVHTGEYYGLVGQTVAGLASLAAVMLVWTGIALSLRRLSAWNGRRRKRGRVAIEKPVSVGAVVGDSERFRAVSTERYKAAGR